MSARPTLVLQSRFQQASAGFTLLEAIFVIVILGILSAYVAPKAFNTSQMTLDSQARTLASDLQRAQLLATTTGKAVNFCTYAEVNVPTKKLSGYLIQIDVNCPASMPDSPSYATQPVAVTLDNQATLATSTLTFNSLGQPSTEAGFQLKSAPANSRSITVKVAAVTGLVSMVSP